MKLLSVNVSLPKEVLYTNNKTGMRRVGNEIFSVGLN